MEFQGKAVEYEGMVKKLFKTTGMHPQYEGLMHAAIGISGEVGEILTGIQKGDTNNLTEEFGDMEFYMVSLAQTAGITEDELHEAGMIASRSAPSGDPSSLLVIAAADILDTAKRSWVYGNDLEDKKSVLAMDLGKLTFYMDVLYDIHGLSVENIRKANMDKLIGPKGRYRDLVYTDAAATARADKQEEAA